MTLIAYALRPESVDIVTDSLSYNDGAVTLGYTEPKSLGHALTDAPVAIACAGAVVMSDAYEAAVTGAASRGELVDVDELALWTPEVARHCWQLSVERRTAFGCREPDTGSTIFAAGWSQRRGRMAVYQFRSGKADWAGTEILEDLEMQHDMWTKADEIGLDLGKHGITRPSAVDRHWFYTPFPEARYSVPDQDAMPDTDTDWAALAARVRVEQIARPVEHRTLVGGAVHRTTITRDAVTQNVIYAYDDTGDEWAALLAGSLNPAGAPYKWTGVGRNEPCPCGTGVKYKHCHDPRALRSVA